MWFGCKKVSPACANCYAETSSPVNVSRKVYSLELWGDETQSARRAASTSMIHSLLNSHRKATRRMRVFCSSLSDVFEQFEGKVTDDKGSQLFTYARSPEWWHEENIRQPLWGTDYDVGDRALNLNDLRFFLLGLIQATPMFDWLLLTKRPEHVKKTLDDVLECFGMNAHDERYRFKRDVWYNSVVLGTTVENENYLDRVVALLDAPAGRRFLSLEPLMGYIDLKPYLVTGRIDWVIVGGESNGNHPMHPEWARRVRDDLSLIHISEPTRPCH
jgi:protein gp37